MGKRAKPVLDPLLIRFGILTYPSRICLSSDLASRRVPLLGRSPFATDIGYLKIWFVIGQYISVMMLGADPFHFLDGQWKLTSGSVLVMTLTGVVSIILHKFVPKCVNRSSAVIHS